MTEQPPPRTRHSTRPMSCICAQHTRPASANCTQQPLGKDLFVLALATLLVEAQVREGRHGTVIRTPSLKARIRICCSEKLRVVCSSFQTYEKNIFEQNKRTMSVLSGVGDMSGEYSSVSRRYFDNNHNVAFTSSA